MLGSQCNKVMILMLDDYTNRKDTSLGFFGKINASTMAGRTEGEAMYCIYGLVIVLRLGFHTL